MSEITPPYSMWKKNGVMGPASYGGYLFVITICAIFLLCTLIAPASAAWVEIDSNAIATDDHIFSTDYALNGAVGLPVTFSSGITDGNCQAWYGGAYTNDGQAGEWVRWTNNSINTPLGGRANGSVVYVNTGQFGSSHTIPATWSGYTVSGICVNNVFSGYYTPPGGAHGYQYIVVLRQIGYASSIIWPDYVNFVGTPNTGYIPFTVSFTDQSTPYIPSNNWWNYGDGTNVSGTFLKTPNHTYSSSGNYTVSMGTYNASVGWRTQTRYGYIIAESNASLITTYFQCIDGTTKGRMFDATISAKDETTGTWYYQTDDLAATLGVETPSDHTLSGYCTASGYVDGSYENVSAMDGIYQIPMWPLSSICTIPGTCGTPGDPGTGNVNLLIQVTDYRTNDPIADAQVAITGPTGSTDQATTTEAGVASFFAANKSTYAVQASAPGYKPSTRSITTSAFGPDNLVIGLDLNVVTTDPTLPPGVTPTETVLPGCEDPNSDACYASQDRAMANDVRQWIQLLIPFFGLAILLWLFAPKIFR